MYGIFKGRGRGREERRRRRRCTRMALEQTSLAKLELQPEKFIYTSVVVPRSASIQHL